MNIPILAIVEGSFKYHLTIVKFNIAAFNAENMKCESHLSIELLVVNLAFYPTLLNFKYLKTLSIFLIGSL
jgi:hypothetical protein